MTERPILFSAPMVRAILESRKSQTRRVVKPQPTADHRFVGWTIESTLRNDEGKAVWALGDISALLRDAHRVRCPYGAPGDRLWVRETWGQYRVAPEGVVYRSDEDLPCGSPERWRPSIHMPRWASRILLEVTAVRVERLQDISEADAIAEGCQRSEDDTADNLPECPNCNGTGLYTAFSGEGGALPDSDCTVCDTLEKRFRLLWEQINGPGSWDANPWVWVVEFRRVEA